ncbi:hypothetical protein GCM10010191_78170 [Actinomadura vinacea]|uniref:Transposase DDE domain-containing protein n=1 Tax=Actinomadura vinacea TaxID=115336 RepID=A0ABN3K487_9ACTN
MLQKIARGRSRHQRVQRAGRERDPAPGRRRARTFGIGPRPEPQHCGAGGHRGNDRVKSIIPPRRWVVERSFAWLGNHRRLSKDYEDRTSASENVIYLAMSMILLRRLTDRPPCPLFRHPPASVSALLVHRRWCGVVGPHLQQVLFCGTV